MTQVPVIPTEGTTADPSALPVGLVIECDIAEGIPAVLGARAGTEVLVVVRLFSEPIGMLAERLPAEGLDQPSLARVIARDLASELSERFAECGLVWDEVVPVDGLTPPRTPRFLAGRERVMREGPVITAAICTRDRPEGLANTLETLSAQEYQRVRVLVVDNAPSDDRVREVVRTAEKTYQMQIDYVVEPRPGLSWARNRAIEASDGEVIAYVDDDERCDRWWAAEIARGYVEHPEAGAVSGLIVPVELVTETQVLFENYSGARRGRGFTPAVFSPATTRQQSPLYPSPPFGAGGNMSFRRAALEMIGGFDCALGAGTRTAGGEDTAAFSALLLAGGTIVYQPTAIVRHNHRREYAGFRRQLQGYGRGLTAFYLSVVLRRPAYLIDLARLGAKGLMDEFSSRGDRLDKIGEDYPRDLLRAHAVGLLQGPFAYVVAVLEARRLRRMVTAR